MKVYSPIKQIKIAVTTAALSFASFANAGVLYDESVSGDSSGGELFSLTNGNNLFLGSQAWEDVADGLRFVVASGSQATVQMNYTYNNLPSGEAMAFEWDLVQLPDGAGSCTPPEPGFGCTGAITAYITLFTANSEPGYGLPSSPLGPPLNTVVLGPGTYAFTDNYKFVTGQAALSGALNYSINIEQTAVPLPSALFLFGTGIFGLMGFSSARKKGTR